MTLTVWCLIQVLSRKYQAYIDLLRAQEAREMREEDDLKRATELSLQGREVLNK